MISPRRLSAVVLSVRDVERSLAWYREKFGFQRFFDDAPNSKATVIGTNGITLALNPLKAPRAATNVETDRQACVQLFSLEIAETDLCRVADEFAEDHEIIELNDHPKYKSRIVEDPDGHAIELVAV